MMKADLTSELLVNARLATCVEGSQSPYGMIDQGAILVESGCVRWCGPEDQLPVQAGSIPTKDLGSRLVTPSLIDCHTHVVYGGNRAGEFEQRLNGKTYAQISALGGGIVSTVNATRRESTDDLVASALPRVDALIAEGVSVIEIKSGYGLDQEAELKMLRAARKIQHVRAITVRTSFLGAHAIPANYKGLADQYIDDICIPTLEIAHAEGLVDAVDGFCESIAFDAAQIERVFEKARELGLPVKLHAEQLALSGGAELACRFDALSADHLEYLDEAGVIAMAGSGTVAVLLPGAFYTLRETQLPPVEFFRKHNVPIGVATDCNPGSSPMSSILLAMNMACTLFGLTPEEALYGVTRVAAQALGLADRGVIAPNMKADFAVWNVEHPAELAYRVGFNPLHERLNYL